MTFDIFYQLLRRFERPAVLFGIASGFCIYHCAAQPAQAPFGGVPWPIPGIIEVENFDEGGEGVSYHDTTSTNEGGAYRNTDVDIYASPDASGGYYVRLREGDWVEFTVNIQEAGVYDVFARVFLQWVGEYNQFHLFFDGKDVAGPIPIPGIGGPSAWREVSKQGVVLDKGQHTIQLYLSRVEYPVTQTIALDKLRFERSTLVPSQVISGSGQPGFADGAPDLAQFSANITGLDVDLAGNIYVADSGNYRVRKVSPGGDATTLAGNGTDGTAEGAGSQAQFSLLRGIAVDDNGICYVADGSAGDGLNKIRGWPSFHHLLRGTGSN